MAQGAIILLVFAFMMCLSCLSSSAAGSGIFYACSDGTMSPDEFDFKKCTNFGVSAILEGTEAITGLDVGREEPTQLVSEEGDLLVPASLADEEDPNETYYDFFGTGKSQNLSGLGVIAASATSKTDCARICYENEVPMRGEGSDECNGFVSDGFTKCILYPSTATVSGSSLPSGEKSYALKRSRSGGQIISYDTQGFLTGFVQNENKGESHANGDYGTPWAMGPTTDVTCSKDGNNGLLTSFNSVTQAGKVGFRYTCLLNDKTTLKSEKTTIRTDQGQRNSCGGKRKGKQHNGSDIGFLNQHEVNCLDNFIYSWGVRPDGGWKGGMTVKYKCTNLETPDATECEDLVTTADFGSKPCKLSNLNTSKVQCPSNKALTQFRINSPAGKISYRCCPKPTEGGSTTYTRS